MYRRTSTTDVCAKNVSQDKYHRGAERMTPHCLRVFSCGTARFFMRYCAFFHAVLRVFSCGKENENANNVY